MKDPSVLLPTPDGRIQNVITYRPGISLQQQRMMQQQAIARHAQLMSPGIANLRHTNGTPLSASSSGGSMVLPQVKPMMPPNAVPQVRISSASNVIRPPGTPVVPSLPTQSSPPRLSSPVVNGTNHDLVNGLTNGDQDVKMVNVNGIHSSPQGQSDGLHVQTENQPVPVSSPMRPKSQTPTMTAIPNGFTIPSVNSYSSHIANSYMHSAVRPNGLNPQMMKSAFASLGADVPLQTNGHVPLARANAAAYLPQAYSQQLVAARQMQWATMQRPASANLVDANGIDANLAVNLGINGVPARVPSTNGTRPASLGRAVTSPALAQALAVGQGSPNAHVARLSHSAHLLSPGLGAPQAHQSPPRPPQPSMASPSLQSQVVGTSGTGY